MAVDSCAAIVQDFAEVDHVPKFDSGSAEAGEDRLLVSRIDFFNGLKFHKHAPLPSTNQVGPKSFFEPGPLLLD